MFIMRLAIIYLLTGLPCIISLVGAKETYLYEKQNFFGMGRRLIPKPIRVAIDIKSDGHPGTLPTSVYPANMLVPSRSLYQGTRNTNDRRVFRRRFEYEAKNKGHHVLCEGVFDCDLTHLAVESTEAIPVILRGGAGHRYFTVIVKAKPGRELKGQVRAYCRQEDVDDNRKRLRSNKHFQFKEVKSDSNGF